MNWRLIIKDRKSQPAHGTYSDWKIQISDECYKQCVYCSIHEAQFGGIDHFHIDHFRPKSKFPLLKNDILNLFYSCPVCNRFKSDDWPGDPDPKIPSYVDPSITDYSKIFNLVNNYELEGKFVSAKYLVLRLYLNRAQLIYERREALKRTEEIALRHSVNDLICKISRYNPNVALEVLVQVSSIYSNLLDLEQKKREIRPYELAEIRRP